MNELVAGSRGSKLALTQTNAVIDALQAAHDALRVRLTIIKTTGDHIQDAPLAKIDGKGLFTKELEQSLLARQIDFAVHSLKDLPVELPPGLCLAAYLKRELPNDVLIGKDARRLHELPPQAVIATGSVRRQRQLLAYRPDLRIVDVRGNVDTRLEKLRRNNWDGLILAYAGLHRLGRTDVISEIIPDTIIYPAVGQGIIAVECRDEPDVMSIFAALNHRETAICAIAERAFLRGLGGGCQAPVGVTSAIRDGGLHLAGMYLPDLDAPMMTAHVVWSADDPSGAGTQLAAEILKQREE